MMSTQPATELGTRGDPADRRILDFSANRRIFMRVESP